MASIFFLVLNIFNFVNIICVSETEVFNSVLHRSRRQFPLLFPNSTLLQFNAGIGAPSPAKNINLNYAFQANFQLPWNRTQIPMDILVANNGIETDSRRKRALDGYYENDAKLFHFYKYVEQVLNGFGHDGKACVRQALCQVGAEPLHSEDEEDLLHELASFALDPTNDAGTHISEKSEAYPYIKAYRQGQEMKNCTELYRKCKMTLVDMFSKLHDKM